MDSFAMDDEHLWDELNHRQTQESLQHRRQYDKWDEIRQFASVIQQAAVDSYREQRHKRRERTRQQQTLQQHNYLNDFGISGTLEPSSLPDEATSQPNNTFVHIPKFPFRPEKDGWASIANLDVYLNSLYQYFYHRGLTPILCKGMVELLTLFFTWALSVFLFVFVDWVELSHCLDETTCHGHFFDYLHRRPFAVGWSIWNIFLVLYVVIFFLYGIVATLGFLSTVQEAINAKWVFEERLGISERKLLGGAVDWDRDVVTKLVQLQSTGEYRISVQDYEFDALIIANRILRKENYMIAMFNHRGVLDLSIPMLGAISDTFYCSSLEFSIYFCVLNYMFNHKYQIRPAFYLDPAGLRRRLQICGMLHVVFMPFLLFFVTIYFGLQNTYDWKNTKQYLGPREWSQPSKWIFREFNELPHIFERRLSPSYQAAERYLGLFGSNEIIAAFGRILVFVGGSLGAVLFAFAAMNDAILLHVKIADWNLLWYAGLFGLLYSAGKALIPAVEAQPKSARNLYAEIDEALEEVALHTHYLPSTWKGRGWDQSTHKRFSNMFQFKAKLFATELVSLVVAPYLLCVTLPRCAESICEFVLATRAEIPGAGEVCGYAKFDFEAFGDERWGVVDSPMVGSLSESILQTGNVDEATRQFPRPRARFSKMEKSLQNFKEVHPSWSGSLPSQNNLGLRDLRNHEVSLLNREQDLHRQAAARQLETLERIEEGRNESVEHGVVANLNDSYIPSTIQAPADAGAGGGPRVT